MTDTTDPARELAAHIADQPVSVVQAALRHLGMRLHFELQDLAVGQNPAGTAHDSAPAPATGATEATDGPEPADDANGPQTGAQDREAADDDWERTLRAKLRGAQAETRDLRDEQRKLVREADALTESNTRLRSELREARAAIQRVRALHRPLDGPGSPCDHCGYATPCPTAAAIDEETDR